MATVSEAETIRLLREMAPEDAILAPSPNFGPRKGGGAPSLVILHYTAMPTAEGAVARLRDPAAEVSAHYLIDARGALFALVPETARAWHAGVSVWRGERDINSASIGVELAHPGEDEHGGAPPFPEPQMRRLEALLASLAARWGLGPDAALAHSDVAPGRKIDPGGGFDWTRLDRLGLAIGRPGRRRPTAEQGDPASLWSSLSRIGYGDWPSEALLDAFRRRFRPEALNRPLEPADACIAAWAADRFERARGARRGAIYD